MRARARNCVGSVSMTSSVEALSPKSPLSPEQKSKLIGNFSPVHTRRRIQSEDVSKVLPDFAEFPISRKCPKLVAELGTEVRDVEAELLDLQQVQSELNMFLTHCIDHQKKISGEIHFMETGDYRSEDISKRLMPYYESRTLEEIPPSTSAEADEEVTVDDTAANVDDEYESSCPTVNMPGKFWKFIKDYEGSIDEAFLYRYYTQILSPLSYESSKISGTTVPNNTVVADSVGVEGVPAAASRLTSPTSKALLKRQNSCSKRTGRPAKIARVMDESIDSLLAETIQAWSTEEKLNSQIYGGISESHECNGIDSLPDVRSETADEMEEQVDRKFVNCEEQQLVNKFDSSYLGIEYKNLKDTVISVINASQGEFIKEGEKKLLKKEVTDGEAKEINGTSGSRVMAQFESFKKTLINFVKGVIESTNSIDSKPIVSGGSLSFSSINGNGLCIPAYQTEELEVGVEKSEPVELGQGLDQVTAALKKAKEDLQDRNEACRYIVITVWHRMLAEYLRNKLEKDLFQATKELTAVREKYFRDYPPKRPANEKEREECAAALKKYNNILNAYYQK
ncbi:unnamed protein product [Enterobius vermicularis]|uniref:Rho-GAP domain-containing protein n=1 Tax=Enterobius vermicularis TaxID=51028 RepID=A0A0N4V1P8_ENTVE|nr:unnamed protein product [Enterobius vermicularis]